MTVRRTRTWGWSLLVSVRLAWLRAGARSWRRPAAGRALAGEAPLARGADEVVAESERATRRSQRDEQDLLAAAYESFQREIHSFALHATRDPDGAADVTHESFLRLVFEARAGRVPDNVRAWLYRVASNLIVNRARHARVADRVRRTWSGGEEAEVSPEWLTLRAERTAQLRDALARLPRDARVGLLLAANGFSGREIAGALGRSELATRSLLCRARGALREQLAATEPSA